MNPFNINSFFQFDNDDNKIFENSNCHFESLSSMKQDIFVLFLTDKASKKYFLDIGYMANHAHSLNNTYFLEKNKWDGLSIDNFRIGPEQDWLMIRNTKLIIENQLSLNFKDLFEKVNFPELINYVNISVDGESSRFRTVYPDGSRVFNKTKENNSNDNLNLQEDGFGNILKTIENLFISKKEFEIITVRHDLYLGALSEKTEQKEFLKKMGYILVCENVCSCDGKPKEDWWINPKYISKDKYEKLMCKNVHFEEIIKKCID